MWSVSFVNGELVPCKWSAHQQEILILAELEDLKTGYEAATGWACVSAQEAFDSLRQGNLFVFVDHRPMCLSEAQPWFSAERVLTEEFVGQGIDTDTAVAVMLAVAAVVDVKRFVLGTRAAANGRHAGLANKYQRSGLFVSTVELMGVVDG